MILSTLFPPGPGAAARRRRRSRVLLAAGGLGVLWLARPLGIPGPPPAAPPSFPRGIVIHHTASPPAVGARPVDAALVDEWHRRRGFARRGLDGRVYHIGYHYLVLPDGTLQVGRPANLHGAHARGSNDTLGVCLVGNFDGRANRRGRHGRREPSPRQLSALRWLLVTLMRRHDLSAVDVHLHREVTPTTVCPGDRFPAGELRAALSGMPARSGKLSSAGRAVAARQP